MKKLLLATLIALPSSAFADFIGIHGQIGVWHAAFKGATAASASKDKRDLKSLGIPTFEERGFEKDQQKTGWIAVEHPLPVIPNVRLSFLKANSIAQSSEKIILDVFVINAIVNTVPTTTTFIDDSRIVTEMDLSSYDATLYWEVLDNWINIDLGFTLRKLDGNFSETAIDEAFLPLGPIGQLDSCTKQGWPVYTYPGSGLIPIEGCNRPANTISSLTPIDLVMPLAYGKLQLELPLSGLFASATLQGVSLDGNSMYDIDMEIGYMFDFTVMELGASIGYRKATLEAKDLEGLYSDAALEGTQLSLKAHF